MTEGTRSYPHKEHWSRRPDGVHWATAYIASDHRKRDLEKLGEWLCPCRSCTDVRRALRAVKSPLGTGLSESEKSGGGRTFSGGTKSEKSVRGRTFPGGSR